MSLAELDEFESCFACCTCPGCDYCMQREEYFEETEFYGTDADDLACCCGSD